MSSEDDVPTVSAEAVSEESPTDDAAPRERSSIRFPYGDLDDAIEIARTIHDRHGTSCTNDQLAADLKTTTSSSSFRTRLASAATFGVIENVRGGTVVLTRLGSRIADPQSAPAARVESFLQVPLYKRVYEAFRGQKLPGDGGLETEIVRFGVAPKQSARARQVLLRSAETAGFFASGRDRLVEPPRLRTAGEEESSGTNGGDSGADTDSQGFAGDLGVTKHPLIQGLLAMLPDPGTPMSDAERQQWLMTLDMNLAYIYRRPNGPAPAASIMPAQKKDISPLHSPATNGLGQPREQSANVRQD